MAARTTSQVLTWITRALALSGVALAGGAGEAAATDASSATLGQVESVLDGKSDAMEVSVAEAGDLDEDGGGPPLFE